MNYEGRYRSIIKDGGRKVKEKDEIQETHTQRNKYKTKWSIRGETVVIVIKNIKGKKDCTLEVFETETPNIRANSWSQR